MIDDGVMGRKDASVLEAAAVKKKDTDQKTTVTLSCEEEIKPKSSGRKSRPDYSEKTEKAFTSILSARSKVCFIIFICIIILEFVNALL